MIQTSDKYINDIIINGDHINRIYLNGEVYWGNVQTIVPHHTIEGAVMPNTSSSNIYFNRQLTSPGGSSFTGGYSVSLTIDNTDWYVDTQDAPQTLVGCFANNRSITSVNIYRLDCSNLNSIENMFENCNNIQSVDLSHFDTSNVTVMGNVFSHCYALQSVDVKNWDMSKVERIWGMFRDMHTITSIDLSGWQTSSLVKVPHTFYGSYSLQTINLSGWDATHIDEMNYMFNGCTSLRSIDFRGWDLSQSSVDNGSRFRNCNNLTDIYVSTMNTLNKLTNNLNSQGNSFVPSSATIHYDDGTTQHDYVWSGSAWV